MSDPTTTKIPPQAAILAVQIVMAMGEALEGYKGGAQIVRDPSWTPEVREACRLIREANA